MRYVIIPIMKRLALIFIISLLGAYLLSGMRILNQSDYYTIVDSKIFSIAPHLVKGKIAYAPFPFLSLYKYDRRDDQIAFLQELNKPFKSREGSEFFIQGKVTFCFDGKQIIQSHASINKNGFYPVTSEIFYEPLQKIFASILIPHSEEQMRWFQLSRDAENTLSHDMRKYRIVLKSLHLDKLFFESDLNLLPKPLDTKILFIGLDGADWDILNPLMEAGRLPHLKALKDNGSSGRLLTVMPSLSPIIWSSIATGKKPEKHGIMDFLAIDERTGKKVPITSNLRKAKALWNIFGDLGMKVGIVGWWATWPAEKVSGYIVTERVAYQLFGISSSIESEKGKTYPSELYSEIKPFIVEPEEVKWKEIRKFFGPEATFEHFQDDRKKFLEGFETLYAAGETFKEIFLFLEGEIDSDFEAVYFEGTDTVSHLFMPYRRPKMEGISDDDIQIFGDTVDHYYEYIDGVIGEILERKDESWTVIICSDHGFKTGMKRPISYAATIEGGKAAQWHDRYGILIISGRNINKGTFVEEGRILDLLPTMLALYGLPIGADMDGRVLSELFHPEFLEAHPIKYRKTYEEEVYVNASVTPIESEMDQEIKEKLLSLGYISPCSDNSFNNRGLALMAKGDFDEAIEQFQKALEINPSFTAAMVNLGMARMQKGETDEAIAIFQEVLEHNPENIEVENMIGNVYMNIKEYRLAERHFRNALLIEPAYTDAINSLGILYEKIGQWDEAMKEYKKTINIDPHYAEGYNNIGNIWRIKGNDEEALQWYEKATKADPFFIGSYNNMALIYQEKGEIQQAIRFYNEALEKAPTNAIVMNNLGSLYFSRGDINTAMDMWEKSIEVLPSYESPYNNLGAAYGKKGIFDKEIEMYQKALNINPDYADARLNLALAYIRRGESKKGAEELYKIVQKDTNHLKAWMLIARANFEKEDYVNGLKTLEEALIYNPRSTLLLNMAGEASVYIGDEKNALRYFKQSLAVDPNQEVIKRKVLSLNAR